MCVASEGRESHFFTGFNERTTPPEPPELDTGSPVDIGTPAHERDREKVGDVSDTGPPTSTGTTASSAKAASFGIDPTYLYPGSVTTRKPCEIEHPPPYRHSMKVHLLPATLALLSGGSLLLLPSCVSWHAYERQVRAAESAQAQAAEVGVAREEARRCAEENESLVLRNGLLTTELASTRRQYSQLESANANLLHRYDRYIEHADFEAEANDSERDRLARAAARREREAREATATAEYLSEEIEETAIQLAVVKAQAGLTSGVAVVPRPAAAAAAAAYGEYVAPATASLATRAQQPPARGAATSLSDRDDAAASLHDDLLAELTGYLPSELHIARVEGGIRVEYAQTLLFPEASASLAGIGPLALRQLARAIAGHPLDSVVLYVPPVDWRGNVPAARSCLGCATRVSEALVAAGVPPGQLFVYEQPEYDPRFDAHPGGHAPRVGSVVVELRVKKARAGSLSLNTPIRQ